MSHIKINDMHNILGSDDYFPNQMVKLPTGEIVQIKQSNLHSVPNGTGFDLVNVNSQNPAQWGANHVYLIPSGNMMLKGLAALISVGSCTATGGTYCRTSEVPFWVERVNIYPPNSNSPIQSITGLVCYLYRVLHTDGDELEHYRAEAVLSNADRNTLAGSSQLYYLEIPSLFDQVQIPLNIFVNNSWRIEIQLRNSTSIIQTDGTNPVFNINYMKLRLSVNKMSDAVAAQKAKKYSSMRTFDRFLDFRYTTNTLNSGTNNFAVKLAGINGNISHIQFVNRLLTDINAADYAKLFSNFQQVTNTFNIQDSTGVNIVGNIDIEDFYDRYVLVENWFTNGAFTKYPNLSSSVVNFLTNYIYCYSWNTDPERTIYTGSMGGSQRFLGQETINLNYTSNLGATQQQDVVAYCYCNMIIDGNFNVTKQDS